MFGPKRRVRPLILNFSIYILFYWRRQLISCSQIWTSHDPAKNLNRRLNFCRIKQTTTKFLLDNRPQLNFSLSTGNSESDSKSGNTETAWHIFAANSIQVCKPFLCFFAPCWYLPVMAVLFSLCLYLPLFLLSDWITREKLHVWHFLIYKNGSILPHNFVGS